MARAKQEKNVESFSHFHSHFRVKCGNWFQAGKFDFNQFSVGFLNFTKKFYSCSILVDIFLCEWSEISFDWPPVNAYEAFISRCHVNYSSLRSILLDLNMEIEKVHNWDRILCKRGKKNYVLHNMIGPFKCK